MSSKDAYMMKTGAWNSWFKKVTPSNWKKGDKALKVAKDIDNPIVRKKAAPEGAQIFTGHGTPAKTPSSTTPITDEVAKGHFAKYWPRYAAGGLAAGAGIQYMRNKNKQPQAA